MKKIKCVLIAAGGTGGHVFPGIAVAKELTTQGVQVAWLGTQKGLDASLVPKAGIEFHPISIGGLRGKGKLSLCLAPFKIIKALWSSCQIIRKTKADCVLGMGGYVSGPAGLAALLMNKPLYIHEQNAIAGLTNRYLAYGARKIFTAFPNVFSGKRTTKVVQTGNPVRAEVLALSPPEVRASDQTPVLRILVVGGSQGAGFLNQLILETCTALQARGRQEIAITHQTGARAFEAVKAAYEKIAYPFVEVKPFIDDMATAYAAHHLVICRAGALSIAELASSGIASILVPFPHAVDDHQTYNARHLQAAGAALLLQEKELNVDRLLAQLEIFKREPLLLLEMAKKARLLATPDATTDVVKEILK